MLLRQEPDTAFAEDALTVRQALEPAYVKEFFHILVLCFIAFLYI